MRSETFQRGECVLNEGESTDVSSGVYFIRSGVAEVLRRYIPLQTVTYRFIHSGVYFIRSGVAEVVRHHWTRAARKVMRRHPAFF